MFEQLISLIKPLDTNAMEKCQLRLDNLTKPLGSLHSFEHLARQMAGITSNARPRILQKSIILMAADHGIAAEGPAGAQTTTAQMIDSFCTGNAAINVFAEHVSANPVLVDIGVAAQLPPYPQVHHEKIAYGTKNIACEAAMTREQVLRAIEVGINIAREEIKKGVQVLGLGVMGNNNQVSSTAIITCYSAKTFNELVGNNSEIVDKALTINHPNKNNPVDVLRKVGGLEIAGLVGVILGAAADGAAIVLDGLTTSAAALIAVKLAPGVKDYLIGSHFAVEPAHKAALDIMNVPAHLHLEIKSAMGIGAALGMSLIDASLHMLNDMKTFGEAEVAIAQDGPGAWRQCSDIKG